MAPLVFRAPEGTAGSIGAKTFTLLGLTWVRARKSSPSIRKIAQTRRFMLCWASFSRKCRKQPHVGRALSRV
ncbi:hypothetical protein HMPREF0970_01407 [Schaalia odontolytica F0309]|uniref:Uncharacterized protein n=1 Tax=Schaalia odontolytica F0309 TaxID=649742 RepID=D4TZM4_9ACTO|nr:hypothetical protein HMPREF0970_01407 [Schaalia odontolytica F0309]